MLTEIVSRAYLNKSRLIIKDEYGVPLPYESEVHEYGYSNGNSIPGYNTQPDYQIEGFFRRVAMGKDEFIIASPGPHLLLITGIPTSEPSIEPFRGRAKTKEYSSYWEDKPRGIGYLFQVFQVQLDKESTTKINNFIEV